MNYPNLPFNESVITTTAAPIKYPQLLFLKEYRFGPFRIAVVGTHETETFYRYSFRIDFCPPPAHLPQPVFRLLVDRHTDNLDITFPDTV